MEKEIADYQTIKDYFNHEMAQKEFPKNGYRVKHESFSQQQTLVTNPDAAMLQP